MSEIALTILGPFVLTADLLLLLWGKVVGDVECLADLFWRLALNHIGDGFASNIKEGLNIEVVGGQDDLEQHFLVDLHELLVPLINVGGLFARVGVIIGRGCGVGLVMLAPLNDLLEDLRVDIGDWDWDTESVISKILHHVLDEHRALSNLFLNFDLVMVVRQQGDGLWFGHIGG